MSYYPRVRSCSAILSTRRRSCWKRRCRSVGAALRATTRAGRRSKLILSAKKATGDLEKVHKEMWDAIKDQNEDAYGALANELTRAGAALAAEWMVVSVLGKIAVEMTGE